MEYEKFLAYSGFDERDVELVRSGGSDTTSSDTGTPSLAPNFFTSDFAAIDGD